MLDKIPIPGFHSPQFHVVTFVHTIQLLARAHPTDLPSTADMPLFPVNLNTF